MIIGRDYRIFNQYLDGGIPVKTPSAKDIYALLISLYADQMGVEITYQLKEKDNEGLENQG